MRPAFFSIGLFLVFLAAALADSLLSLAYAEDVALACFGGFILLELVNVARLNLIAASILACIGIVTGAMAHDVFGTLYQGAERTVPFMLLFAGVLCLRIPANASPILLSLRDTVVKQPPGRRFIMTSVTSHCLTVVFNLAGITLLSSLIRPGTEENLQRRLGRAVSQGMASASCWAPFFVAAVVIYSNLPTVQWSTVAPVGFVMAMLLIGWSWLTDRLLVRPGTSAAKTGVRETPYSQPPERPGLAEARHSADHAAVILHSGSKRRGSDNTVGDGHHCPAIRLRLADPDSKKPARRCPGDTSAE